MTDPSDLIALPAVAVSIWICTRPNPGGRRLRTAALFAALVATTATSQLCGEGASGLAYSDGQVYVHGSGPFFGRGDPTDLYGFQVAVSGDRGRTWTITAEELPDSGDNPTCLASEPGHCFRIGADEVSVDESFDMGETWIVAWAYPPGRLEFARRHGSCENGSIRASALLVHDEVVFVAMGADGVLARQADGEWQRAVFGEPVPLVDRGERIWSEATLTLALLLLLAGIGSSGLWWRQWRGMTAEERRLRPGIGAPTVLSRIALYLAVAGLVVASQASKLWIFGLAALPAVPLAVVGLLGLIVSWVQSITRRVYDWRATSGASVSVIALIVGARVAFGAADDWSSGDIAFLDTAYGLMVQGGAIAFSGLVVGVFATGPLPFRTGAATPKRSEASL